MRNLAFIISLLLAGTVLGFWSPEAEFTKEKATAQIAVSPSKQAVRLWKDFYAEYQGECNIRWHPVTGLPQSVTGFKTRASKVAPEEIARDFLTRYKGLFQIDVRDLGLLSSTERMGVCHLVYQQYYKDIPVEGARILVHIRTSGEIFWITSEYRPAIDLDVTPTISREEALEIVKRDLPLRSTPITLPTVSLVIYPDNATYLLTYKVRLYCSDPLGDWLYYVDALTGEVIDKRDELRTGTNGNVQGKIFPSVGSDALEVRNFANEYVKVNTQTVTTDASGNYSTTQDGDLVSWLKGPYCWAHNEDYTDVTYSYSGGGGGQDTLDYSVSATTYSWISTTTTTGCTGDDQSVTKSLGFDFTFYGQTYDSVHICSNGFLSFTSTSTAYQPAAIPNSNAPNALVAPFWRDLNPSAGACSIAYESTSTQFVVTWTTVKNYSNSNRQTFQVVLNSDGSIVFQYQSITNDVTTVMGIENQDGTSGKSIDPPANETAVKFTPLGGGGGGYTVTYPSYSWVTTSTSTGVTGDDDSKQLSLGFTFNFYGVDYSEINVCSNGFMSFTSPSTSYQPKDIPNPAEPNALVAPFWRDLNPTAGGTITYSSTVTQFVVTWDGVKNYSNGNTQTFQVILKNDNTITFQYKTITNDVTTSIGIENQDGTDGETHSSPSNYSAVKFTPTAKNPKATVSWTWDYPSSNTHCDEVNIFYQVNYIYDYYKNYHGYTGMDYQMKATVHVGTNYANAYYSPSDGNIYFGDGDGTNILTTSRAADVIYHEYTHGVTHHIYPSDALPYTGQSGAMDEAYSDYFPASVTNDPNIGEWVMAPQYQRSVDNTMSYPDDWHGEVHADAGIYSGALWDIRKATSKGVADSVTFASEFYYPANFLDGREAVLQADQNIYGGSHQNEIKNAFAAHGIGSGAGGSDTTDYTMSSTTYTWWDATGSSGVTGDDQSKNLSLPWGFYFYGSNYDSINVCSNGFMSFTSTVTAYQPATIPNANQPNALLAPYWRDLNPSGAGSIKYGSNDSVFVVTWDGVKNYGNAETQTFQVVLNRKDSSVTYTYKSVTHDYTTVIGIENKDGNRGKSYSYSSSTPANNSAIKFTPASGGGGSWTEVDTSISSPHNYPNNYTYTWTITRSGATKMKVLFSNFDTESGYDFVYIYDGSDNQVARYDGNKGNFWSAEVNGNTIKVKLVTDYSVTRYGFDIDKYGYYQGKLGIDDGRLPDRFDISKIGPNPFNRLTLIHYQLPVKSDVEINIYDASGRLVKTLLDEELNPGHYTATWNALSNPSGIYFVRLKAGNFSKSKKVILIR